MRKRYLVLLLFLTARPPSAALAQPPPLGPEFQVNAYTTGRQSYPSVASSATGNFVVIWESSGQDGDLAGIFGQRYDSNGNPLGVEFQVNTFTSGSQAGPSVASSATGNFVVAWRSYGQDGSDWGVFGQRYDSNGNPLGVEFQVNTYTSRSQAAPSVASEADGDFVVVWSSMNEDGVNDIWGQRYESGGNRLGGEFQVNTRSPYDYPISEGGSSVASSATGNFVVVWQRALRSAGEIEGQRYDSGGNRLGGEFDVAVGRAFNPSVASDTSGNFVVVWRDGYISEGDVVGQRYDTSGGHLGGQFQVNTYATGIQAAPSVSSDPEGNFVVVWTDEGEYYGPGQDGSGAGVFGQRFDSSGNRLGSEFPVNTYTTDSQAFPTVASDANGNFVVVWRSDEQDGSDFGVFGQRFSAGCEASVRVQGDVNTAGTIVPVQVHIAHHRPKTVTVRWKLSLLNTDGQVVAEHISPPHTFEPGDVLDQEVQFQLPDDLASGEYTLDLAIKRMAGTKGATTTIRVIGPE